MAKTKKTTTKTTGRKAELAAKTKKELVAMARELGVPAAGAMSKADLVVVVGGTENSAAPKTETPAEVVPVEVGQLRKPRRGRNVHRVTEVNVEEDFAIVEIDKGPSQGRHRKNDLAAWAAKTEVVSA